MEHGNGRQGLGKVSQSVRFLGNKDHKRKDQKEGFDHTFSDLHAFSSHLC